MEISGFQDTKSNILSLGLCVIYYLFLSDSSAVGENASQINNLSCHIFHNFVFYSIALKRVQYLLQSQLNKYL